MNQSNPLTSEAIWRVRKMDNKDYWKEHREHQNKLSSNWVKCPVCGRKQFNTKERKCFGDGCGYKEKLQEG